MLRRTPTAASGRQARLPRLLALLTLALAAPVQAAAQTPPTIVVGVPNWPSAKATAGIIKVVIEGHLGTQVELRDMASPDIFAGMDDGSVAAHPEAWLPNYAELTAEYVERRGTVRESEHRVDASQNICTTRRMAEEFGVRSLADLATPAKAALFDTDGDGRGEMWIGEATWTSTSIEKIRARSYGYDRTMTLLEAPEDVAMATIDASMAVGKPVAFYCYRPHYLFRLHDDVVPLEEPANDPAAWQIVLPEDDPAWLEKSQAAMAWPPSHFQIDYSASLETGQPEVAAVLRAMSFTADEVADMSYALTIERQDPHAYAASWVETHADRVDAWVSGR